MFAWPGGVSAHLFGTLPRDGDATRSRRPALGMPERFSPQLHQPASERPQEPVAREHESPVTDGRDDPGSAGRADTNGEADRAAAAPGGCAGRGGRASSAKRLT